MRIHLRKLNLVFLIPLFILIIFYNILIARVKRKDDRKQIIDGQNNFCQRPKLKFDDEISMKYFNENHNHVAHTFDSCDKEINYTKYETVSVNFMENKKSRVELNLIILNLKSRPKCLIQKFDKDINQPESEPVKMLDNSIEFDDNFKAEINDFGFFYIYCYSSVDDIIKVVYENVVTILDDNLFNLIDKRSNYKKEINDFKSNLNISKLNFTFYDNELKECCGNSDEVKSNVLILGLDSMSFNNFQRALPITFKYLNEGFEGENIVYENFNSVGQSTHPNIVALLTGIIDNKIFNLTSEMEIYQNLDSTFHDHLPFIWNSYEEKGYLTMYQEDAPSITLFNSKKKGFRYWPTTFYTYPFWKKYYEIRSGPNKCHNKIPTYITWLDQIKIFIESSKKKKMPFFSFSFLTEYTHDDLAVPSNLDKHLKDFLHNLMKNGDLDNTMLLFLSDHGNRLQKYSYVTSNGRSERYMPFLSLKLPRKFKNSKLHKRALENKNKLVTLFDVHQTLRHFLYLNTFGMENRKIESCKNLFKTNSIYQRNLRGISLLYEIPQNRTCLNALISEEFCNCYEKEEIEESMFIKETGHSFYSASLLANQFINNLTSVLRSKCEIFNILEIVSFRKMNFNGEYIYTEILVLEPGKAWFEVTFKVINGNLILNGFPIRLSSYGSQAFCIKNDAFLPSYCFCKV